MIPKPPLIDDRRFEDILAELRKSASKYFPDWKPDDANADAGVMLQHTFARLMEIVIERLNRVPEKQMLSFLHAMNVNPLPPVPARAPLVFAPKSDSPIIFIPKHTAVTAKVPGGAAPVFETSENLTVLPANITCAYSVEPMLDRYGDYTDRLAGGTFTPFIGESVMPDERYFIFDDIIEVEDVETAELIVHFDHETPSDYEREIKEKYVKEFFVKDEVEYSKLSVSSADGDIELDPNLVFASYSHAAFEMRDKDGNIKIPSATDKLGGGSEPIVGAYIKCATKNTPDAKAMSAELKVKKATLGIKQNKRTPEHLFFQNSRLNQEALMLPFGNRPKAGDMFFIYIGDLPENAKSIHIDVQFDVNTTSDKLIGDVGKTLKWDQMKWTHSTKDGWAPIEVSDVASKLENGRYLYDLTAKLSNPYKRKVGGEEGCWLRVMLPTNDCGQEAEYVASGGGYTIKPGTGTFVYPKLFGVTVSPIFSTACRFHKRVGHLYCETDNKAVMADENPDLEENIDTLKYSSIFPKTGFYLGFDNFFPGETVSLYADAKAVARNSSAKTTDKTPVWECFTSKMWQPLYLNDETDGLTHSGAVRFATPPDAASIALFDKTERFWVRVSDSDGTALNGIYMNAVPAEQAATVLREQIGISNGGEGQSFTLRGTPVLTGQLVWVREDEPPTAAERTQTSVEVRKNPVTLENENWVLWHEQNSFGTSQPNSRHYTLDRQSGEIRFGDGMRAMIPVNGAAIAVQYRHGGGIKGNLPANSISRLSTAMPAIEKVYNPIASAGGAESEDIPNVLSRGPMTLRHRGRGVTAQDIEWLVKEAVGAAVDRIKCLPGENGQPFTLMLLPAEDENRPLPDGELAVYIQDYLEKCLPASISGSNFAIVGPTYITMDISAAVVPTNIFESNVIRDRIVESLNTFLHPRYGGLDGLGWEFGRNVYLSEVCALLESIEGVEYPLVGRMSINPMAAQRELTLQTNDKRLSVKYPAGSVLSLCGKTGAVVDSWELAEPILTDVLPRTIRVTGFREGNMIAVSSKYVYSEGGNCFMGKRFEFPTGSTVSFADGFTTTLKTRLNKKTMLTKTMLSKLPPKNSDGKDVKDMDEITVLRPEYLEVTNVKDEADGSITVTMRRHSEDVQIFEGMCLECVNSKIKITVSGAVARTVLYDGDSVTMRFDAFKMTKEIGNQLKVKLTLPDAVSGAVDFMLAKATSVTDTAYLFERELCTPGIIDVQIVQEK